jgi:tRNA nucleotidyltransferase (CCA-adding enzyme)
MGYPPGPQFKAVLDELLTARLDGVVQTRQEEEAFILHHFPRPEAPVPS